MTDRRQFDRRQSHNPPVMLECPYCGESSSRVIETRGTLLKGSVYRRRECVGCEKRFTTEEAIVSVEILEPHHT